MTPRQKLLVLWLRLFFWCAIIFIFSAIPNYKGTQTDFETLHGLFDFFSRKTAHLLEYMLLTIFFFRAAEKSWEELFRYHFLLSFGFSLIFSVSDEWHQTFVFGRTGSVSDVFLDSIGSLVGYGYCCFRDNEKKPVF